MTVCMLKIKSQRWWKPFIRFLKFAFHFIVVMLLLGFGAFGFALIEDPYHNPHETNETNDLARVSTNTLSIDDKFWELLKLKYNISVNVQTRDGFVKEIVEHEAGKIKRETDEKKDKKLEDRWYIFKKWFYFVSIATTTIGYGDIYPRTDFGKMFYTGFSIIGIPLMMTLLASCGDIMTAVNRKFFGFVNNCLCKKKKLVSEELLSSLSILFIFLGYLSIGCLYLAYSAKHQWSLIDSTYFWVVTFTTVGFGDMYIPIEDQDETIITMLIVYRIFGLALLAGLIDSLVAWINVRKDEFKERASAFKKQSFLSNTLTNDLFFNKDNITEEVPKEVDTFLPIKEELEKGFKPATVSRITYC